MADVAQDTVQSSCEPDGSVTFRVVVLDDLNPQYVAKAGAKILGDFIAKTRYEVEREALRERILESDEELERYRRGTWATSFRHDTDTKSRARTAIPIVRASTYGNKITQSQELTCFGHPYEVSSEKYEIRSSYFLIDRDDPRRPVIMRGALGLMIERHSYTQRHIANGFVKAIINRFLRLKKYTCHDRDENEKNLIPIFAAMCKRFYTSHTMSDWSNNYGGYAVGVFDGWAHSWRDGMYQREELQNWSICTTLSPIWTPKAPAIIHPRDELEPGLILPGDEEFVIVTRRMKERAILRANYEMGLITTGDLP